MKTFRIGGIHPKANKLTDHSAIRIAEVPDELTIILSQSIGKPSRPVVKAGDTVVAGQKIAETDGFVSAPLHSPVNGTVKKIEKVRDPQGLWKDAIIITVNREADAPDDTLTTFPDIETLTPSEIVKTIADAGIVGLGGATFPTAVKLTPPKEFTIDTLIVNGAECEPFLTCDDLLMQEKADGIVRGISLLLRALGIKRAIIGIEENKPLAIAAVKAAVIKSGREDIKVETLKKRYPQGGEKQLIQAILNREVPSGALPAAVGVIVDNVATAYAVHEAVDLRRPLTHRVVTVTGPSVTNPGNYLVAIGTPIDFLINLAGGLPDNTGKVVMGGPMMGRAASFLSAPSTKGLSGILILPDDMSCRKVEEPCIRCAGCVNVCPMGLEPYLLYAQANNNLWDDMKASSVLDCIECGSCQYTCPSHKPLLDFIRLGKNQLRKKK